MIANTAVVACGVRAAGDIQAKSQRSDISEAQIAAAMKQLSEAMFFLQQQQVFAEHLRWTFERGEVCCASGRAGAMALLVLNRGAASPAEIEQFLKSCPVLKV